MHMHSSRSILPNLFCSDYNPLCPPLYLHIHNALTKNLEESSTLTSFDTIFQNDIILVYVESARSCQMAGNRAIQCVKVVALNLGPYPECRDTESACTEGPEKTTKGSGDESTYAR